MRLDRLAWLRTLLLVLAVVSAAAAQEPAGTVAALEGTVEVLRAGQAAWAPLGAGAAVAVGDRVRTAAGARVRLLMRDESVLTLGAESELAIDTQVLGPAANESGFRLPFGALRAVVGDRYGASGSRFQVETPTAVAGVRGTTFVVLYDRVAEETRVVGLVHAVRVRAVADARGLHEVVVGPEQITRVKRGGLPTKPRRLSAEERDALVAGTLLRTGGRSVAPELGTPELVEGGPGAAPGAGAAGPGSPGEDPARALDATIGVPSPQDRAVDQPVEELRRLERQRQPPPIPPSRAVPRSSGGGRGGAR